MADEILQVVRVMDGLNRLRFSNDPELLAAWESASNVVATPKNGTPKPAPGDPPPTGGEIRPAGMTRSRSLRSTER